MSSVIIFTKKLRLKNNTFHNISFHLKSRWPFRHGWRGESHTRLMKPVAHFFISSGRLATAAEGHHSVHRVQIQVRRNGGRLVVLLVVRLFWWPKESKRMSFACRSQAAAPRDLGKELFLSEAPRGRLCCREESAAMHHNEYFDNATTLAFCSTQALGLPTSSNTLHTPRSKESKNFKSSCSNIMNSSWLPLPSALTQLLLVLNQRV